MRKRAFAGGVVVGGAGCSSAARAGADSGRAPPPGAPAGWESGLSGRTGGIGGSSVRATRRRCPIRRKTETPAVSSRLQGWRWKSRAGAGASVLQEGGVRCWRRARRGRESGPPTPPRPLLLRGLRAALAALRKAGAKRRGDSGAGAAPFPGRGSAPFPSEDGVWLTARKTMAANLRCAARVTGGKV